MNFTPDCVSFEEVWLPWQMLALMITGVSFSSRWDEQMSSTISTPYLAKSVFLMSADIWHRASLIMWRSCLRYSNCTVWFPFQRFSLFFYPVSTQVTGDTIYNLLRLAEVQCDGEERPLKPHKIRTTEVFSSSFRTCSAAESSSTIKKKILCRFQVLHSPFDDIIPRELKKAKKEKEEEKKSQSKATK